MKRLMITLFILATLLLNMLPACDGLDDHYSTNPTYRLSFSTDTLAFDTIFSTIGSTTRQFMIYNKNSEPLSIESIMLSLASIPTLLNELPLRPSTFMRKPVASPLASMMDSMLRGSLFLL